MPDAAGVRQPRAVAPHHLVGMTAAILIETVALGEAAPDVVNAGFRRTPRESMIGSFASCAPLETIPAAIRRCRVRADRPPSASVWDSSLHRPPPIFSFNVTNSSGVIRAGQQTPSSRTALRRCRWWIAAPALPARDRAPDCDRQIGVATGRVPVGLVLAS